MYRKRKKLSLLFILVLWLTGVLFPLGAEAASGDSEFWIHFIDVGQADAALVSCDGHYMLIDGGNKEDSSKIYSVLQKAAVPKLDMIVGTHPHEDHIGGIPGALNYTTADLTLCSATSYDSAAFRDFDKYAEKNGNGIVVPKEGAVYSLGSAAVRVLSVGQGETVNNNSIVLRIDYYDTSFLFTGDASRQTEQVLLDNGASLGATVLKVGHHGSDSSTTYPFLREVAPKYAVISVGADNSYGHPDDNVLSRLRDADVAVYRTDLHGDIFCLSDGKTVTFTSEWDADTIPFGAAQESDTTADGMQSEGIDYILNKNTQKFHYAWCKSVNQMKESSKLAFTGTREEVIAMGYKPCGNCHP